MRFLLMQPWLSYRGAETMSIGLTRQLIKRGYTAKIMGLFLDRQDESGVNFILPPKFLQKLFIKSKFLIYMFGAPYLFYMLLKNYKDYDVLVPYNLPTSWFSIFFGKPVIWMAQGSVGTSLVNKIIAPSNYLAKKIYKRYKKQAVVINNPIAQIDGKLSDLPEDVLKLRKENKFVFLMVGAINSQKRQVEMLQIFNKLLKIEPKCALVFVGEGIDLPKLKGNNIYVAGYVPKNKIGAYYKICDLNLMPSTNETFGATPLEALKYGKNSLITNDSGIKEVVGGFAIVSKKSKLEIYKNLLKYINNKKYYDNLSLKHKNKIINKLTWEKYTDRFLEEADIDPKDTYTKTYYDSHYFKAPKDLMNERKVRMSRALELLNPKKGEKILDLGVGTGDLAYEISKSGAKVTGIDYSKSAIETAKKKFGNYLNILEMDASKLDFPDSYFDKVISIDLIEHIYPDKLKKVFSEVKRVTRKNGKFIVETSPNTFFWYPILFVGKIIFGMKHLESEKYHINLFNYFRLKKELSEYFNNVNITLHNDGKNFLSSRVIGSDLAGKSDSRKIIYKLLKIYDKATQNIFFEKSIFFGHDLWAVAKIKK